MSVSPQIVILSKFSFFWKTIFFDKIDDVMLLLATEALIEHTTIIFSASFVDQFDDNIFDEFLWVLQLLLFNLFFYYFYIDIKSNDSQHFSDRIDLQCLIIQVIDDDNINNAIVRLFEINNSIDDLLIELCIRCDIHKNDIWIIFLKIENCEWDLK